MGTDIHFYVEHRENGKWVTCDKWTDEYGCGLDVSSKDEFYDDRNYDLFAMLADVRNGYDFVPLASPRGIPEDCCPEYKDLWGRQGEHTPSYCTVAELLEYDWTRETLKRGVLDLSEYLRWRPWYTYYKTWPKEWSGGISGPGIVILESEYVDRALVGLDPWEVSHKELNKEVCERLNVDPAELEPNHRNRVHVNAQWGTTYATCAKSFLTETMPRLWRLGKPEDVRCLFFFDS